MAFASIKDIKSRFDRLVGGLRSFFKSKGLDEKYDIWKAMHDNEIGSIRSQTARSRAAVKWFKNQLTNRQLHYKAKLMVSSQLYMFDYDDPKFKDTLAFFDTQPLVLMAGVTQTTLGPREVGINLHLLPPQVRKVVLMKIYSTYKLVYGKALKDGVQPDFQIDYKKIINLTKSFGVGFAVRMYIPERRKKTIRFNLEDWERAIWIPSKGYAKISPLALQREWKKYMAKQRKSDSSRLSASDSFL